MECIQKERQNGYLCENPSQDRSRIAENIAKGDALTGMLAERLLKRYGIRVGVNVLKRDKRGRFAGDIDIQIRNGQIGLILEAKNWSCRRHINPERDILSRVGPYLGKRQYKVVVVLAGARISKKVKAELEAMGITVLVYPKPLRIEDEDSIEYGDKIAEDVAEAYFRHQYKDETKAKMMARRRKSNVKMLQILSLPISFDVYFSLLGSNDNIWGFIDPGGGANAVF